MKMSTISTLWHYYSAATKHRASSIDREDRVVVVVL